MQGEYRSALIALSLLIALVLLIACVNVANLMVAQAAARERDGNPGLDWREPAAAVTDGDD